MVSTPRKISSPLRKVSAPRYGGMTESSMHFYHKWVTLFLFLVVVVCVLCGFQGGLEPKRRVKDMDVSGDLTVDGKVHSNYLKFITSNLDDLAISAHTDAETDAGFTMAANTIHISPWLGDTAAALVLPSAKRGVITAFIIAGQADGAANLTITRGGSDTYAAQSLNIPTLNIGDGTLGPYTVATKNTPATGATLGNIVTAATGSTVWTVAATATNNMTNIGSRFVFFCEKDGEWRVAFQSSELGTGVINATFTIA